LWTVGDYTSVILFERGDDWNKNIEEDSSDPNANERPCEVLNNTLTRDEREFTVTQYFVEAMDIVEVRDSVYSSEEVAADDTPDTVIRSERPDAVQDGQRRSLKPDETIGFDNDVSGDGTIAHNVYGDQFQGMTAVNRGSINAHQRTNNLYVTNADERDWIRTGPDDTLSVAGQSQIPESAESDRVEAVFTGPTRFGSCSEEYADGDDRDRFEWITTSDGPQGGALWFGESGLTACSDDIDDHLEIGVSVRTKDRDAGETVGYEISQLYDQNSRYSTKGIFDVVRRDDSVFNNEERNVAKYQDSGIFFESHDDTGRDNQTDQDLVGEKISLSGGSGGGGGSSPTPTPGGGGGSSPTPTPGGGGGSSPTPTPGGSGGSFSPCDD
jgi:hypothetical protein